MVKKELTQLDQIKMLFEEKERIDTAIELFMKNIDVEDPQISDVMLFILKSIQDSVKDNKNLDSNKN